MPYGTKSYDDGAVSGGQCLRDVQLMRHAVFLQFLRPTDTKAHSNLSSLAHVCITVKSRAYATDDRGEETLLTAQKDVSIQEGWGRTDCVQRY